MIFGQIPLLLSVINHIYNTKSNVTFSNGVYIMGCDELMKTKSVRLLKLLHEHKLYGEQSNTLAVTRPDTDSRNIKSYIKTVTLFF